MEFFIAWLILASVHLAATMSPGPAFAVAVRNSLAYGRRAGILTAIGLGLGLTGHVVLTLCGIAVVISQSVLLFNLIKYAGAAYLIYMGVKALMARKTIEGDDEKNPLDTKPKNKAISDLKALQIGFLTNMLNPKAVLFFTAIFSQFIAPETPWPVLTLYGMTSVIIEAGWFSGLAIVLTNTHVKARISGFVHWIERICGGLFIALGVRLALSKI